MLRKYTVLLEQNELEFIDGLLEEAIKKYPDCGIAELRATLNKVLYCETSECDGKRMAEGERCAECTAEFEYWRKEYNAVGRHEMETAKTYVDDMKAAGREHLLTEADLDMADTLRGRL